MSPKGQWHICGQIKGSGEDLNLVMGPGKGVGVFDRAVGKSEDVTKTLDFPVGHPGKGGMTIGCGRGRGIHDVTGEQEALFEHILTVVRIYPDEYLAGDDHSFLDVACAIGPEDQFLLGSHVGLDFVDKAISIVEDFSAHKLVVSFDHRDVPGRGVDRPLFGAFWHASGARP